MTTTISPDQKVNAATLTSFALNNTVIRGGTLNSAPVFVAKDVFSALHIQWKQASGLTFLDADETVTSGVIDSLGRTQQTILLTESGLYATIFQSRKAEARSFRKWVTSEVLPTIRKQGGYVVGGSGEERIERLRGLIAVERAMLRQSARKSALLSGEPLPERRKRVREIATPLCELPGSVPIRDWVRQMTGLIETKSIVLRLTRRLRVAGCPLGKVRNAVNTAVLTALPEDIASVIHQSDLDA
jgi:prophage antirepressor-like protein